MRELKNIQLYRLYQTLKQSIYILLHYTQLKLFYNINPDDWFGFNLDWMFEIPIGDANTTIDGLAFDYAGDLYVVNSTNEKLYKFVVPTNNNTCITPAPKAQVITKPSNPTLLDNTTVAPQVQKIVRDGQVLIIRDGKTFNMMGQEVR